MREFAPNSKRQQTLYHVSGFASGEGVGDLGERKSMRDEFVGPQFAAANPIAERTLRLALAEPRRPLVDEEIEVVRPKRLVERNRVLRKNAIDANRAAKFNERQNSVDDLRTANGVDDGIEWFATRRKRCNVVGSENIVRTHRKYFGMPRGVWFNNADPVESEQPRELDETQTDRPRTKDENAVASF